MLACRQPCRTRLALLSINVEDQKECLLSAYRRGVQEVAVCERSLAENNKVIIEGLQRDQIQGSKMSHICIMRQTEGSEQSNGISFIDAAL